MALVGPPPMLDSNPFSVMLQDLRDERSAGVAFPPGRRASRFARTRRFADEPLEMLLESYERYGPVFTLRLFHSNVVFMLGPAANHYMLVSHASNFRWREGHFRDLIGLMGDGLLTIDGDFHRRSRMIMLPAFHRENIAASFEVIVQEADARARQARAGRRGRPLRVDAQGWRCAWPCARCSAWTPTASARGRSTRRGCSRGALAFYASDYFLRVLRMRGTPWWRMQQAAARQLDALIYSEIAERRATGERGQDILSLLLDAQDEDGNTLNELQIRDEVMTLLFAGHDTTTSTVSFMFYELARNPQVAARLIAEQDAQLAGAPTAAQLTSGELPELEMVLDETLRKYPPAWVGPRRAIESFEFAGHTIPARAFVNYCSWASHHLPDVFEEPRGVPPRALRARGAGGAAEGRLRALRRRLAHVHRHALRPAGGAHDRHADPLSASRSRCPTTSSFRSARCRRSARADGLPMRVHARAGARRAAVPAAA